MLPIKSNDHWTFLEEIEAPMWIDLTLEGKSNNQNLDDKWFSTHHQIHQCSSDDLKSAFYQLFEDHKTLDFELSGSCSPNIPKSVSRSRGKDYDSKKWRGSCHYLATDKLILSERPNPGSATKLKLRSNFRDSTRTSSSTSSLVYAGSLTENVMSNTSNPLSAHGNLATGSSSGGKEPTESRASSTITTDNGHLQQQKVIEVTSQPLGTTTSTLLSVMRRSLRKSCITRQASRIEVNNSRTQSSTDKSSSSKSSVGSSSNLGFGVRSISSTLEQQPKKHQDTKGFARITHAAMNKMKYSSVGSTLLNQVEDVSSNSKRVGKSYMGKSGHLEASKPKMVRAKASLPQKRDEQNTCLKPVKKVVMAGTGRSRTAVVGKENGIGKNVASHKCDVRNPSTGSMVKDQKRTQHNVPQRVERRNAVNSKGKNRHPGEQRNLEIGNRRVYLR